MALVVWPWESKLPAVRSHYCKPKHTRVSTALLKKATMLRPYRMYLVHVIFYRSLKDSYSYMYMLWVGAFC